MTIERCDLKGIVFDELVADDANVHIERMSNSHIWMAVESAGKRLVLNFSVHKRSLNVTVANEPPAYSSPETREGPADLVGALQNRVHTDAGPFRAGKSVRETCACTPGDAFACRRATLGNGCICDCHERMADPPRDANGSPVVECSCNFSNEPDAKQHAPYCTTQNRGVNHD